VNEDVFAVAFAGGVLDRNLRQSPFVGRDWSVNAGRPYPIVTVYQLVQ
jgi:hypothetical protein